jgi:hypothetical protein
MILEIEQVGSEIDRFIGQDIEVLARETKFVQRTSKLNGRTFVQALTFGFLTRGGLSLNDLAETCADLGVGITAQGLDERITPNTVGFLKAVFARALTLFTNRVRLPLAILQQFSGVYLADSSVIPLPQSMAQEFPGCGGNGPAASLKVQLSFEFLHGNMVHLALRPGREPDQVYQDFVRLLPQGALSIADLGYFTLKALKAIMYEQRAHFLSRFLTSSTLLTPERAPFPLLERLQAGPRQPVEFSVLLGKQAHYQLPCRLIALPAPQEVADRRRQKAKEKARRQKKAIRHETLALMDWSLFVTTVPAEMLPMEHVALLYSIRWQIELVFKLWKSHCALRQLAGFRRERILVELYGKLIGVVLTHFLIAPLRMPEGPWTNREISPVKVRKILSASAHELNRCLGHPTQFQAALADMLSRIARFGFKQKRTKEPNTCHALALASAAYCVTTPDLALA